MTHDPAQPTDRPMHPADRPPYPADRPMHPADRPPYPADRPTRPTDRSAPPAPRPSDPATRPIYPAPAPGHAAELARMARRTLAETESVTLLIHGIGRFGPDGLDGAEVVLEDQAGVPVFDCAGDSLLVQCEGMPALLNVSGSDPEAETSLVLIGRLRMLDRIDGESVRVGLDVERVVLEHSPDPAAPVAQYEIPVQLYAEACPLTFAEYADSLVKHTNDHHAEQLRRHVASRAGLDADLIAWAGLTSIDRLGARLEWIDVDGAHGADIAFTRPAGDPSQLACQLRRHLPIALH